MSYRIAERTRRKLLNLVTEQIDENASPAALVEAVEREFKVVAQVPERAVQPPPKVGQVWRRRATKRVVVVTEIDSRAWGGNVIWRAIDESHGQASGRVIRYNWADRFDFLANSEDEYKKEKV